MSKKFKRLITNYRQKIYVFHISYDKNDSKISEEIHLLTCILIILCLYG